MDCSQPETWVEILSEVRKFSERCRRKGSGAWFRGQAKDWPLKATLHRHIESLTDGLKSPWNETRQRTFLHEEYKSVYRKFTGEAWPLLSPPERTPWGSIFAMQHHGLPTRLLDWTESFGCAVFFAQLHREPSEDAVVWMLEPEALKQMSLDRYAKVFLDDSIPERALFDSQSWHPAYVPNQDSVTTVAVATPFTNPRMAAQRSAFTLMGDSFVPFENQFEGKLLAEQALVKLILSPGLFDEANEYLSAAGLSAFSFFPDLHGIGLKHQLETESSKSFARKFHPEKFH